MTQSSTKAAPTPPRSVALQYVQQQVAQDMAVLYKAFRPEATSQSAGTIKATRSSSQKGQSR